MEEELINQVIQNQYWLREKGLTFNDMLILARKTNLNDLYYYKILRLII